MNHNEMIYILTNLNSSLVVVEKFWKYFLYEDRRTRFEDFFFLRSFFFGPYIACILNVHLAFMTNM